MAPARRLLDFPLSEIDDEEILELVVELHEVTTVPPSNTRSLFSFLSQVLYPAGYGKRYKLEENLLTPGRLLLRKVRTFEGKPIFQVCDELAQMHNQTAEFGMNMHLYVFLNKYLPDYGKKREPPGYDPRSRRG